MDGSRFDTLSRALVADHTRRGLVRLLRGVIVAGSVSLGTRVDTEAKGKKRKKRKKRKKSSSAVPPTPSPPPPPPFCASQPDGAPCGFCRICQGGSCSADTTQNNASCGSDGTGRCLNGVCNPVPSCVARSGSCRTVEDCCSAGSTNVPTVCSPDTLPPNTCQGRSDTGQPCHSSLHCWSGATCIGYVCQ